MIELFSLLIDILLTKFRKKKPLDYCVLKSPIYNIVYAQKECCENVLPILIVNRYE